MANEHEIGSESWLRERFPDKDWHRHRRTDGGFDLCDGTPSDCSTKEQLPVDVDLRRLEFLEILADGAGLTVNGVPWREMFDRVERVHSDSSVGAASH